MANAGLGILIALGIGIAATLALLYYRPGSQAHQYNDNERTRDYYSQQNSWSQTTNKRNTRQKNRKPNGAASEKKESICTICMTEGRDEFISLPCSHEFHRLCIINWKKESPTCPLCRYAL